MLSLGVAWPGCASTPTLKPNGRAVIPVATTEERATATVKLLNEVVIQLPKISKPGDEWMLFLNDSRLLEQLRPVARGPDGEFSASFLAIKPGRRLVRFFALPPGRREAEPSQTYELIITIE